LAEKRKALIYARVSTLRQERKDLSIPGQIKRCREKLEELGYTPVRVFEEAKTASESADRRPAFQEAITMCLDKTQGIEAFCVLDSSRFARHRVDSVVYKHELRQRGVKIVYTMRDVDENDIGDMMSEGMEEIFNAVSAILSGRKAKMGMLDKAEKNGLYPGGAPPIGYRWKSAPQGKVFDPDPKWAPLIRRIFGLVLEGKGVIEIAKILRDEGITTPKGKPWRTTSLARLLHNVKYKGDWSYLHVYKKGAHTPIVDPDTFGQVQKIMEARAPNKKGDRTPANPKLYFSGVLYCGECHSRMDSDTGKSKNGRLYFYYVCSGRRKITNECPGLRIPAREFDTSVREWFIRHLISENNVLRCIEALREMIQEHNEGLEYKDKSFQSQISEIDARIERLYTILETSDEFDLSDLAPRIKGLERAKKELREERALVQPLSLPEADERLISTISGELYDLVLNMTPEEFSRCLKKMGVKIFAYKSRKLRITVSPSNFVAEVFAADDRWRAACVSGANTQRITILQRGALYED